MAEGYQYRVRTDQGDFMVTLDRPPESAEQLRSLVESRLSSGQRMTPLPPPIGSGLPQPSQQLGPVGGEELTKHMVAATREPGVMGVIRDPMVNLFAAGVLPGAGAFGAGRLATSAGARVAAEAIGSAGGEAANQMLGVTRPSATGLGVAAAAPPASRILGGLAGSLYRFFPGSRGAAETLNTAAAQEAASTVRGLAPTGPSAAQLFQLARAQNVTIPANATVQAAQAGIGELQTLSQGAQDLHRPAVRYLQGLVKKIQGQGGVLNPDELQNELAALGDITKSLSTSGKPGARFLEKVKGALLDDLDTAATTANPAQPAAATLQAARQTFLREKTVDELQTIMENATKLKRGQDVGQFNANQALDALKRNRFYTKAFTPAEQAEVEKVLTLLNKVPALPPAAGATFGSGPFWEKAGKAAAGAGIGAMSGVGAGTGAAIGGVLGVVVPGAHTWLRNIGIALQTHEGRQLLTRLFAGGELTPRGAAILGAYAATVGGQFARE